MPRWSTKGEDRLRESITIPLTERNVTRLAEVAATQSVSKTELARRFVIAGLEAVKA